MTGAGASAGYINSLAFNVVTPTGATLYSYEIKLVNTSFSAFPTTGIAFQSGLTSVYGPQNYQDVSGWNTHTFKAPYYWNGTSNILVEVCFNNASYVRNAVGYYTSTAFNSTAYTYSNAAGNCTKTTSITASTKRPNMKLNFISPTPPVASFVSADSLWLNIANTFINNSTNNYVSYWDISGISATRFCNSYGCFIDSNTTFKYTFTQPGTYELKLVVKGFFGVDSMKKIIHVDIVPRKPLAAFSISKQVTSTSSFIYFYDSSQYGVSGWEWGIYPPCNGCTTNPNQFPNLFSPSVHVQNPSMYPFDHGVFDICLKVWNDRGSDSLCKKGYLTVLPGYLMCNGTDSFANEPIGYIYDSGGPDQNYQIGLIGQCKAGFVINPSICSDTVTLYIDEFKLRTTDILQVRNGPLSTSPLIASLTGSNLPASSKILKAGSGKMYLKMTTGSGTPTAGDSGFIAHWNITPACHILSSKNYFCLGDSQMICSSKKPGRSFEWKYNNQKLSSYIDTFCYAKYSGIYNLTISSADCSDTSSLSISNVPKIKTDFEVNKLLQCVNNNSFVFHDITQSGNETYYKLWLFGDNTFSFDSSAVKTYTVPGTYQASLLTSTSKGCRDTSSTYIRVAESPIAKILLETRNNVCEYDSILLRSASLMQKNYTWYLNGSALPKETNDEIWSKTAGNYTLRVLDHLGCDSLSAPLKTIFKMRPAKPGILRNADTLFSSATSGIRWYYNDTAMAGADQQFIIPSLRGAYRITTDSNGCINSSDPYIYYLTALNNASFPDHTFHVFPNPATSVLNAQSDDIFGYVIIDITGRMLIESKKNSASHQINVSDLNSGVYYMKLLYKDNAAVIRFEKL